MVKAIFYHLGGAFRLDYCYQPTLLDSLPAPVVICSVLWTVFHKGRETTERCKVRIILQIFRNPSDGSYTVDTAMPGETASGAYSRMYSFIRDHHQIANLDKDCIGDVHAEVICTLITDIPDGWFEDTLTPLLQKTEALHNNGAVLDTLMPVGLRFMEDTAGQKSAGIVLSGQEVIPFPKITMANHIYTVLRLEEVGKYFTDMVAEVVTEQFAWLDRASKSQ
jgi:hypothetical protein